MSTSIQERFWAKVDKTDTCWLWQASTNQDGYGHFKIDRIDHRAHRVAYEWLVGDIPSGLVIDHLCRVRSCVNPAHLEPVTNRVNVQRGGASLRTDCPKGHRYDAENTRVDCHGKRYCRACDRERQATRPTRSHARKVAA